jgi:DNA-binding MarR family transcriptional regulator
MSMENERDVRAVLTREKFFSLHPKPLERWLWQQGVPQAAERVFWIHWEEGMRRGDWCSELSLRQIARECAVDCSTVTRAYQVLKGLGLIRREDAGRDPLNPFRRCIAITEVLIPRELLVNLSRYPNRHRVEHPAPAALVPVPVLERAASEAPKPPRTDRHEMRSILAKFSEPERQAFFSASQERRRVMAFDTDTQLTPEERGRVLDLLMSLSTATPSATKPCTPPAAGASRANTSYAKPRKLSMLQTAQVRSSVLKLAPPEQGTELFRQVLWSMEEGALRRFDARLALNIALKKIREGGWTKPNRLPPNWLLSARTDTCSAA